jgi:hypothetical protein
MAIHEVMLRDALTALAEQSKNHYILFSYLVNEVAALRETVKALQGPNFTAALDKHRIEQMAKTVQEDSASKALYDEIIRRMKNDVIHDAKI